MIKRAHAGLFKKIDAINIPNNKVKKISAAALAGSLMPPHEHIRLNIYFYMPHVRLYIAVACQAGDKETERYCIQKMAYQA